MRFNLYSCLPYVNATLCYTFAYLIWQWSEQYYAISFRRYKLVWTHETTGFEADLLCCCNHQLQLVQFNIFRLDIKFRQFLMQLYNDLFVLWFKCLTAWWRTGNKLLSEPMMTQSTAAYASTAPNGSNVSASQELCFAVDEFWYCTDWMVLL